MRSLFCFPRSPTYRVCLQVTAPLFSSRLFDYGEEAGDDRLPAQLDVAKAVNLARPLSFYGREYSTVYVLSNGAIALDQSLRAHVAKILPSKLKLLAPYWNRNELKNGGNVWFRELTSGRVLERGQSEIRYQYELNVRTLSCLLVTWERMQPMGVSPLNDEVKFGVFRSKQTIFSFFLAEYKHFSSGHLHDNKRNIRQLYLQQYRMDASCRGKCKFQLTKL